MPDTFLDLVKSRRSVRGYSDKPIEQEKINYVLEAARLAPSACNKQPWRFAVISDKELRMQICKKGMGAPVSNPWASSAPVIIVLSVSTSALVHTAGQVLKGVDYRLIDAGIAGEHLCLAAEEQGLGTCWIGWFKPRVIRKLVGIPRGLKPVSLITVGYPKDTDIKEKLRKPMDEICVENGYSA